MSKRMRVVMVIGIVFALFVAVATAVGSGGRFLGMRHAGVALGHVAATCRRGRLPRSYDVLDPAAHRALGRATVHDPGELR